MISMPLWNGVEWDWFSEEWKKMYCTGTGALIQAWIMNMPIQGWNECLITYVLAASSPTHLYQKSYMIMAGQQRGDEK